MGVAPWASRRGRRAAGDAPRATRRGRREGEDVTQVRSGSGFGLIMPSALSSSFRATTTSHVPPDLGLGRSIGQKADRYERSR